MGKELESFKFVSQVNIFLIMVLLFLNLLHVSVIGYSYERLDGSVRGEERYLAIQNFNETEETFIFLLSTRAGRNGFNAIPFVFAVTLIFNCNIPPC